MHQPTPRFATARVLGALALVSATALPASSISDSGQAPLRFFAGKTEMVSTVKVMMKKPYHSRTVGNGRILGDGSLALVQQVYEEGRSGQSRNWQIRQVAPNKYIGTMTEAVGPVLVEEIGNRYRFKFRLKGNLAVEQWMTPLPDGKSARSNLTVRKFGMKVASSTGTIRKIA